MFFLLGRTIGLAVVLLVLVSGISCREHARHPKHLKDVHSAKKFNILTHSRNEDNMVVVMKGSDGTMGQNGPQGDAGLPGIRGPPGPAGLKGAPGVCTKEQCESNELKHLIQRLMVLERYVQEKQNQTGAQPPKAAAPPASSPVPAPVQGQPVPAPVAPAVSPQQPITSPPQPPKPAAPPASSPVPAPVQGQPAPAPAAPAVSPQQPNTSPPQSPKPAAPPVSSPVPAPVQGQPAPAPVAPAVSPQQPNTSPPQSPKPAAPPVSSPVPAPASVSAVPAGSPQVLWGSPAPPPVSTLSSPIGFTIQSTLEAPGTVLGGNGQVDIQGVVTPQVSVQGYSRELGTVPGLQSGTPFKKSSISHKGSATKPKLEHRKSAHYSADHHKTRTHKVHKF